MAHKESPDDFAQRIYALTGLRAEEIPDASANDPRLSSGQRIASSPHGELYLVEHLYQGDDGADHYRRAVLIDRGNELPLATLGADGALPNEQ